MDASDCIFCKIVAGDIPATAIYEDDHVLSFLDIGPLSEGHSLVIPKTHVATVADCPAEEMAHLASCLGVISQAVLKATQCEGYNILCNNEEAAGQVVHHLHIHIIPRMGGDGILGKWQPITYAEGRMEAVAQAIREHLA